MTAVESRRQAFDISRVVNGTFGPLKRNPGTFFGLAALLSGLPQAAFQVLQRQAQSSAGLVATSAGSLATVGLWILLSLLMVLVLWALSGMLQAALVYGVAEDLNGRRARFGDCLSTGFRFALPVIGISVLYGLAIALGFVLLIVPGVILAIRYIVAVPAEVMERAGVLGAFGRSANLTKGSRWAIFALMLVYAFLALIVEMVIGGVMAAVIFGSGAAAAAAAISSVSGSVVAAMSGILVGTVTTPIGAAAIASIYVELRTLKEGADPTSLAAVFD